MAKYFKYAFAEGGDVAPVPNTDPGGGVVNYVEGFTNRYEGNLLTDPLALAIPRDQDNQIKNDITGAIKQLQEHGVPDFITSLDNAPDGLFSYSKYATVLFDDGINGPRIYESLIDANNSLPTDQTKWRIVLEISFKAYQTIAQIIPATGATVINIDTILFANNCTFDTSLNRFQPTNPGRYLITANLLLNGAIDPNLTFHLALTTLSGQGSRTLGTFNNNEAAGMATLVADLNGTSDYVQLGIGHTNSTSLTTSPSGQNVFIQGFRIN